MLSRLFRPSFCAALVATCIVSAPALPHHSFAMFDQTREVELHGVVREFQWTNPHVWIEMQVQAKDGSTKPWSIEAGSPNNLRRKGWSNQSLKVGEAVTLWIHPLRDASAGGLSAACQIARRRAPDQLRALTRI